MALSKVGRPAVGSQHAFADHTSWKHADIAAAAGPIAIQPTGQTLKCCLNRLHRTLLSVGVSALLIPLQANKEQSTMLAHLHRYTCRYILYTDCNSQWAQMPA
jgi:hypothetical protein